MGATSNEGVGIGSVEKYLPKIVNGVVKKENIQQGKIFENFTSDILISTADGTAGNNDASSITIKAGDGYPLAVDPPEADGVGDDADGGSVFIYAGKANGNGEGGNIEIFAGDTGNGPDANAGNVTIRGGDADSVENSDAGGVNIYGGDGSSGTTDSEGGDINIEAGDAGGDGEAGHVHIHAGDSGTGDGINEGEDYPEAGDIEITAGNSLATTDVDGGDIRIEAGDGTVDGRGGDIEITTGNSVGTDRAGDMFLTCGTNSGSGRNGHIYIQSMPIMPVYANATARDAAAGTATNGMFCYNTATSNIEVYVGGAWKSVDVTAIV
jgi:hypothetical protein